jgi:hypothetical protein
LDGFFYLLNDQKQGLIIVMVHDQAASKFRRDNMMHVSLICLSLAGMGLSTVMIIRSLSPKLANLFLGTCLLVLSFLILVFSSGFSSDNVFLTTLLRDFGISLFFTVGPLAFFYVRGMLSGDIKLSASDLLHFIVFAFQLAGMVPYLLSTGFSLIPAGVSLALCILHLLIYFAIIAGTIIRYKKINLLRFLNVRSYRLMVRWLISFTSLVGVLLAYILYLAFSLNDFVLSGKEILNSIHKLY